jgi:hypothetical protein
MRDLNRSAETPQNVKGKKKILHINFLPEKAQTNFTENFAY